MPEKIDYKGLEFKCGIEIHQQLDTDKLFCNCPSIVHDKNPDIRVTRKLFASAGEKGEVDVAASHEQQKGKHFVYDACKTSSCLVELDEEPPHEVNKEALDIVLQVSQLLNAKIVDQIRFMRKTVIDGSNTTGFQRTALVALDGYVDTSKGKVKIPLICLEEEAAKKTGADKHSVSYRLDRLGVALIEVATDPDIIDAEHAKETAEKIGLVLRSTGRVKRGIGTIRQDVNISIKNGTRVEIKGFQDLKSIPKVIDNEIRRHLNLIKKGKKVELEVRKAESDFTTSFLRPIPGSARMYPETDVIPTIPSLKNIKKIELIEDKIARYKKNYKLNEDIAKILAKKTIDFDSVVSAYKNIAPTFLADVLVIMPKEIRKRYSIEIQNIVEMSEEPLNKLDSGEINKEAVMEILVELSRGKKPDYSKFKGIDDKEVEAVIKKIIEKNKGAPYGALMGQAMAEFRGKVDGKKVSLLLKKLT